MDIILIEKYFDDALTNEETKLFKDRLTTDVAFKKLFDREKLLINTVRLQGASRDLAFLKTLEEGMPDIQLTQAPRKRYMLYWAAAAVALIITLIIFFTPSSQTPEELYAAYYKPYPNVFEPTVRSNSEASEREEAFQAYERGDYTSAVPKLQAILRQHEEPGVLLLLGNAEMVLDQTEEAKKNFLKLINQYDELDLQAKWYLSLCYIRLGEIDSAKKILKELGDTEISYATKAKELLRKVK